jgi:hypothetical protein
MKQETRNDYIIVVKSNGKIALTDKVIGFSIPRAFEVLKEWVSVYKNSDVETTLELIRADNNKIVRQIMVGGAK